MIIRWFIAIKKGSICFWIRDENLSKEDQQKYQSKESVIDLITCAMYGQYGGCHTKPENEDRIWNKVEFDDGWNAANYKISDLEMTFDELDLMKCSANFKELDATGQFKGN